MKRYIQILTLLYFLFLAFLPNGYAYNLRQISSNENLSNNSIVSLHQDRNGRLWIGTCDGLNMYNGRNISTYQPKDKDNALSGNIIDNILETNEEVLWIQTYYGLNRLDRKTNTVKHFNEFKQSLKMAKDKNNILFIIQDDNFIQYFSESEQLFKTVTFPGVVTKDILKFAIDVDNKLWLIYKNGQIMVYEIVYSSKHISFRELSKTIHPQDLEHSFHSNNDILLVDSLGDLYTLNLHAQTKELLCSIAKIVKNRGEISSIIQSNENIFIGYKTNGVQVLIKQEGGEEYVLEDTAINSGVFCLLKDKYQDIVWIGTDGQGVYMYSNDTYTIRSTKMKDYIPQIGKPIRSIYKDEANSLWIGTKGDGLLRIENYTIASNLAMSKIERITTKNSPLHDDAIYCTSQSKKDILWIGTENGLNHYDYKNKKVQKTKLLDEKNSIIYIHDIYEQDSVLWIATVGAGIVKAKLIWTGNEPTIDSIERIRINNKDVSSNYFFSIYPENDSIIWFANRGYGAFKVNAKTMAYETVTFANNDSNRTLNEVFSITKDRGIMYFGTSAGLIEYQSKDTFNILDDQHGFPNNTIHAILKDESDNSFWISTNRGLTNYDPKHGTLKNYAQNDGLDVVEFSDGASFEDKETGVVYFGGVNGFVTILKNKPYSSEYTPKLMFDGLTIFGKSVNMNDFRKIEDGKDIIQLDYKQNFISIQYNVVDFLDANNYSFHYKIEGANDQWIDNGNSNVISLTNFDAGKYALKVKYLNRTTGQNSAEYALIIKILPPWYLTHIAFIAYLLLLVALLAGLLKLLNFRNMKRREMFVQKLETQHKDELYESKLSFFTSIAHEFCTPLTLIYGPCNQILEQPNASPRTKQYAEVILRNAERLNSLIQDLIEFKKIETHTKTALIEELDITSIVNDVIFSFQELAHNENAKFYKKIAYELKWNSDKNHIVTIVTNLLSNAFKYRSINGSVEMEVKELDDQLIIKVSNTGKGIDDEDLDKIFDRHFILDNLESENSTKIWSRNGLGLAITGSMVSNLGGEISIDSTPNEWTHFIVKLPQQEKSINKIKQNFISSNVISSDIINTPSEITLLNRAIEDTKQTILVIDDEIDILWLISDIFSKEYNVITTSSPIDAQTVLGNTRIDIILCDVTIPKIDGIELTTIIKSNSKTAHIPLIIISAKLGVEEQIKGLDAGAELYITKPFNVDFLKSSVSRLINRKKVLKEYFASPLSAYTAKEGHLIHNEDHELIQQIQAIIEANIKNKHLNVSFIADKLNISTRNLYRKTSGIEGVSVSNMIKDSRLHIAENLLLQSKKTIDEVINHSGFTNRVSFYKAFASKHESTPTEYRQRCNT